MRLIAHRGNIFGPNSKQENEPSYVSGALVMGFDVEIDVWRQDEVWFLGHNKPQYQVSESFLENKNLWCHAKNIDALVYMLINKDIHSFWHQSDMMTITSRGKIWTCDFVAQSTQTVWMITEKRLQNSAFNDRYSELMAWHGVCSDWVGELR
jgi:hypothetical protein